MLNFLKYTVVLFILFHTYTSTAQPPDWAVDVAEFQYNMSISSSISLDLQVSNNTNNIVGAFVDGELRGVSNAFVINGSVVSFIAVFSNIEQGEIINFKVYVADQDIIFRRS